MEYVINDEYEMIEEIVKEYDFKKVHKVMTALNWIWASCKGVPDLHHIKKEVNRRLLDFIIKLKNLESTSTTYFTSSGGFKITGAKENNIVQYIELEFVAVDWRCELS